ncbi:hypothetical protein FJ364_03715 [Candidatus Dependentiae bacterium]|nr:hypothetical protein [Candidatus Dependentiae bacterium]
MRNKQLIRNADQFEWVKMIEYLKIGAGYSYFDIAKMTSLSYSEILKLVSGRRHQPRYHVYQAILIFYCKTFYGKERLPYAEKFLSIKKDHPLAWLEDFIYLKENF